MANPVQFSQSTPNRDYLRNQNFFIGIGGSQGAHGPTSETEFYAGLTPAKDSYVIYESKATLGPSIRVIPNENLLESTLQAKFNSANVQDGMISASRVNDVAILNKEYESIVTNNLQYHYDAAFSPSYFSGSNAIFNIGVGTSYVEGEVGATYNDAGSGSLRFNGSNTYVNTNIAGDNIFRSPFSVSIWFYDNSSSDGSKLIDKGETTPPNSDDGFSITTEISASSRYIGTELAGEKTEINSVTYTGGQWNNAVIIFDTSSNEIVLNSASSGSRSRSSAITDVVSTRDVYLGSFAAAANFFQGDIALVSIYSGKLSQEEISQNYNALRGRFGL